MQVHYNISDEFSMPANIMTIGTFDGVHLGHRKILEEMKQLAQERALQTVVVTFDPHPRKILYPQGDPLYVLTSMDEKIALFEAIGIDHLFVVEFSFEFSSMQADEYVEKFIIKNFSPETLVIGYDHKFGWNRTGDYDMLDYYAKKDAFELIQIDQHKIQDAKISSTVIRLAIQQGDIKSANEKLGYPYMMHGKVVKGQSLGSKIGYPTANLKLNTPDKLLPCNGVYAAFAYLDQVRYKSLLYVGTKPSVNSSTERFIEVHLKGLNTYLYHEELKIEILEFVRPEAYYPSVEELKTQIQKDDLHITELLDKYS